MPRLNRRRFLEGTAAGVAVATFLPARARGANERINIAGIGVGGQGWGDIQAVGGENIVAVCDVDERRAADAYQKFASAKRFRDFRKMFDEIDQRDRRGGGRHAGPHARRRVPRRD